MNELLCVVSTRLSGRFMVDTQEQMMSHLHKHQKAQCHGIKMAE
jgi:hypothetical protein